MGIEPSTAAAAGRSLRLSLWVPLMYFNQSRVAARYSYSLAGDLVELLPRGWTNRAQTFRVSSVHMGECIFIKAAWLVKKPETFVGKLLGNTGCSGTLGAGELWVQSIPTGWIRLDRGLPKYVDLKKPKYKKMFFSKITPEQCKPDHCSTCTCRVVLPDLYH